MPVTAVVSASVRLGSRSRGSFSYLVLGLSLLVAVASLNASQVPHAPGKSTVVDSYG